MLNRSGYRSEKYLPSFKTPGTKVRWQKLRPGIVKQSKPKSKPFKGSMRFLVRLRHVSATAQVIAICHPAIATAMIEVLGFLAVCTMVACYALEERSPVFTLLFSGACAVAALYALLIGSYPFMIAEGVWAAIALRKWANSIDRPT
jgi:hypothetical protein